MFKSGYIAIVGRPNVGKSTLLNTLVDEKLAAVTDKPQTTRHRILGIKNLPEGQLLFLDTPGIHKPHKTLNEYMMEVAHSVLEDADLFLLMVEPTVKFLWEEKRIMEMMHPRGKPILLVINKIDTIGHDALLPVIDRFHRELRLEQIFPVSAARGKGLAPLEKEILAKLPEGPLYFPTDQVSDANERFFAAETIREKAMELLRAEVPYSLAVEIEEYREPKEEELKKVVRIRAALILEKDSQKGIVIGKNGERIKRIGVKARQELETRLGQQVFLELFVRIEPEWTKDPHKVKEFAYS